MKFLSCVVYMNTRGSS